MPKLLFLMYLVFSASSALAQNSNSLSAGFLYFDYEEFDENGFSLDHETGFIPGLTASIIRNQHNIRLSIYKGNVDYDGYTQAMTPHKTETDETLYKLSYRYNIQPNQNIEQIQYFLGISHQYWLRSIQPNNGVSGLDETYTWFQTEAGVQAVIFSEPNNSVLFELGLLHTLNGHIKIDLSDFGVGSPELELGNMPGIHGAVFWRYNTELFHQIEIGIDYSHWNFGKSNSAVLSNGLQTITITEPRSDSSHTFLYIGVHHPF